MVHSHISYCINIYRFANITTLKKLVLKQKEAIRIISNAEYREHMSPLFKKTWNYPTEWFNQYSALKFMHKFVHRHLPFSSNETWITNRARIF
jgi:hypothetical protein